MIIVDVFVAGAAKTKGSMEVRNRATGAMRESVIGSSNWRALMAAAVRDDIARRVYVTRQVAQANDPPPPYPGPVAVTVIAYLRPPEGWVARFLNAVIWPTWNRAGDLDKIVRNVLDALGSTSKNPKMNGGAIVDDNLVCRIVAEKYTANDTFQPPGVLIKVETL